MSDSIYKKLKKQKGEKFAQTLRNFHNGILEIPDLELILRHAGQEAEPLLPYLMSLLASNDDTPAPVPGDPFDLLDKAGYEAFHADTLKKQNSIKRYFRQGELLCTFDDAARYQKYHIVHAVKKDADQIKREDFKGKEERQDDYGTSVISIQMRKTGGFISIKNRYNHAISYCDNTFNSNPDNIIDGLSAALKNHFNVEFSATSSLPEGYVLAGEQIFKHHQVRNNIYYGDQAWAQDATIFTVDKSAGDALFEGFLFDNKTKTLRKIDPAYEDSFAEDFNRCYGGNRALHVKNGNLYLDDDLLIGAEKSRIKTLHLPALTMMGNRCLFSASALTHFEAPALTTMGYDCLFYAVALTYFDAPAFVTMGQRCLVNARALTHFRAPSLTTMGAGCFADAGALTHFETPVLASMGNGCLRSACALTHFRAPSLTTMGDSCLYSADALTHFEAPALITMGDSCLCSADALKYFKAPALITMGGGSLCRAGILTHFEAPLLITMGNACLDSANALTHFKAPSLATMGKGCLHRVYALRHFRAPSLTTMGASCLFSARALTHFEAPSLTTMGDYCLFSANALTHFEAPSLTTMGEKCLAHSRNLRKSVPKRAGAAIFGGSTF